MKSKAVICAIAAASLGFASLSFAQGYDQRGFDHRDARKDSHYGARGPQFYRGGRIPGQYRNHQYVVTNWRAHHLYAPRRGQQWVQVGSDYVLIAIATGVIAQLVLSR